MADPMGFGAVTRDGVIEEPWWWRDTRPTVEGKDLPARTDILVVGSGYAGLTCALELARAGTDVTVLDAWAIGGGASSRAAGFLSGRTGVSKQINLVAAVGAARAQAILEEADEAYEALKDFVARETIDCDLQFRGRFVGAHTPAAYDRIAVKTAEYNRDGTDAQVMVPRAEQGAYVQSPIYHGGMFMTTAASINPARYHAGLVDLCRMAGVRLVPMTRVTGWRAEGEGFRISTTAGEVQAGTVAQGTGGYTDGASPWHQRRVVPISSSLVATEDVGADLVGRLLPQGCPVIDTRRVLDLVRPTPDGRAILFGGRASFLRISLEQKLAILKRRMVAMFPELEGVRLTHVWDGQMAFSFDFLPKLGRHAGAHYALACNGGSGIVMMSWLGRRMAWNILGTSNRQSAFEGLAFRTQPFYSGKPWFLPVIGTWYRARDWVDVKMGW